MKNQEGLVQVYRSVIFLPLSDSQQNKDTTPSPQTMKFCVAALAITSATSFSPSSFNGRNVAHSSASSSALCMKYKVAVVGGGPSGACAAEIFAQEKNIDTVLFERKLDNAKPCGGAIPLCRVGEFDLPESVVDRKVRFRLLNFNSLTSTTICSIRYSCCSLFLYYLDCLLQKEAMERCCFLSGGSNR